MALRSLLPLSLLVAAALAGCSDGPPAGDVAALPGAQSIDGTSEITYVAADYPNPQIPGQAPVCPPDQAPAETQCTEPSTTFQVHVMALPEADGNGYTVFMAGGTIGERALSVLNDLGNGMWGINLTEDEDLTGQFERLEIRMGDFAFASAPAAAGPQSFTVNPALAATTVTGSYRGRTLTLDVANLPEGGPFLGRLYTRGDDGNLTVGESFPVVTGPQEFEAERNIGSYDEFHIHVGQSKIYVYQGTLA